MEAVSNESKIVPEKMESSGTAAAIRKETGNLWYDYFFPMAAPETVLLIDCWKDQQALDQHHASSMMEKIAELRIKYDLHMKVEQYVSDEGEYQKQTAIS